MTTTEENIMEIGWKELPIAILAGSILSVLIGILFIIEIISRDQKRSR